MPHYMNGQEAKVGDLAVCVPKYGQVQTIGFIVQINPGTEKCNAQLIPLGRKHPNGLIVRSLQEYGDCVSLDECYPVQEPAAAATAP